MIEFACTFSCESSNYDNHTYQRGKKIIIFYVPIGVLGYEREVEVWKEPNEPHAFFAYWFPMIQKVSVLGQWQQILHAGYSSIFGGFVDYYISYDSCSSQNTFWLNFVK